MIKWKEDGLEKKGPKQIDLCSKELKLTCFHDGINGKFIVNKE